MRSSNIIEKPIEKVVLLFSDGSFIDYNKKWEKVIDDL
jgi:hypothetical protein